VESGDSLWKIAKKVYGDATQYKRITDLNSDLNPDNLKIGRELKLCNNNQTQSQPQIETQNQPQPQKSNFVWWKPWTWF
jgi:nucleoid-associated protein YgaU